MNTTNSGRLPAPRLLFAYSLPEGSRADGFIANEVHTIMAVCTPDAEGGYAISFTVVSDTLGVLPYGAFGEGHFPDLADATIGMMERTIRTMVECKLLHHKYGTLERCVSQAAIEYDYIPDYTNRTDVMVHVECYWPRDGIHFVTVWLRRGKTDIGIIGGRRMRVANVRLVELYTRVHFIANALLPDDFDTLIAQMVHKYEAEGGDTDAGQSSF